MHRHTGFRFIDIRAKYYKSALITEDNQIQSLVLIPSTLHIDYWALIIKILQVKSQQLTHSQSPHGKKPTTHDQLLSSLPRFHNKQLLWYEWD